MVAMDAEESRFGTPGTAYLLAASGGMLDVITYLNHGHVFACAMTGNVVLMGIAALTRQWVVVGRHMGVLAAFVCGVAGSMFLRSRGRVRTALSLEIAALAVAGALPDSFPDTLFTGWIAFFGSLQSATFQHVGRFSYNSTFVTGNLRTAVEGLYQRLIPSAATMKGGEDAAAKWHELGLVCVAFFAGALFAAWLAPRFGNRSFWFAVPVLAGALWVAMSADPEPEKK